MTLVCSSLRWNWPFHDLHFDVLPRDLVGPLLHRFRWRIRRFSASYLRHFSPDGHRFRLDENWATSKDDPEENPGVIADCTGDNAEDSVGPAADGLNLRRHGRSVDRVSRARACRNTGIATLIIWLFAVRALMISLRSPPISSTSIQQSDVRRQKKDFDFSNTHLVWITSAVSIIVTL
jgi:hypothetical protein